MFKYTNAFTNRSGDSLPGYFAKLYDSGGNPVDIFADASRTPISTVSGVANAALSDENGMFRWYVANGTYDIRFYDANDVFVSVETGVPMIEASGVYTDLSADTGAGLVGSTGSITVQASLDARPTSAALAATGGAALVGTTGGVTVQSRLDNDLFPAVSKFGALTPASTAATTLGDAFTAAGIGGVIASLAEAGVGAAAVTNPGVDIVGEKGLHYDTGTGGRRLQNRPGRGADRLEWGHENLVRWLEGLRAAETLKVALVGDSNTEGHVGAVLATYLDSLPNVSVTNYGVSGKHIEQWRTGTDVFASNSKALSNVIAYDPDLIVMCWGTNDPLFSRTAANFATSLNEALTTLRASLDVNTCSIALLTPNAMSVSGQDELYSLQLRPIIRASAERFSCGFFDKTGVFPNSVIDLAAGAMQNKFWDANRVHTTPLSQNILASLITEWLVPRELWGIAWDNIPAKASADLSSTYPPGLSVTRMADGGFNGFTATLNPLSTGGHFPLQLNWGFNGTDTRFAWRVALAGTWSAWRFVGYDALVVVGSLAAGYSVAGGAAGLNTQRDGNIVSLSGRLTQAAAQVLTGTTLCNIATVSHRPIFNIQDVIATVINAGGTVERLRCDLTTAGNLVTRESSVIVDATTVSFNVTYRGV